VSIRELPWQPRVHANLSIAKAVDQYVAVLRELEGEGVLHRYEVEKPLKVAIEFAVEYANILGFAEAGELAKYKFVADVEDVLGVDLDAVKKKVKDKEGREVEITYSTLLRNAFDEIWGVISSLKKKGMPPSNLSRFTQTLLDTTYQKYVSTRG
jgi:hypothetical protein